jgi:hypothetical protein
MIQQIVGCLSSAQFGSYIFMLQPAYFPSRSAIMDVVLELALDKCYAVDMHSLSPPLES